MTAMLLTLGAFAAWTLIGLGLLTALRSDTRGLVIVLTAPALGVSVVTMTTFSLNRAGLPVHDFAVAQTAALLVAAIAVLAWRRPPLAWQAALPVAVALAAMLVTGRPMFEFGFRWIANANDDMGNYVLAAERLLRHSLLALVNVDQFVAGRDYTVAAQSLQAAGARPGSQLTLAWLQGVSGRSGQEAFMPLIVALHGCCVCSVAALAAQAVRRPVLAATVGAALFAVAPLATFGVMQQLLGQTFGLAVGVALVALVFRPELHDRDPRLNEIAVLGLLLAALVVVYVEIGAILFVAYLAFVVWLAFRRRIRWASAAKVWVPSVGLALLLLNTYTISLAHFLGDQTRIGTRTSGLFEFMFVPSAVPAVFGVRRIPFSGFANVNFWILFGFALLVAVAALMFVTAQRGYAAGFVLLAGAIVAVVLVASHGDFGLFKLAMYLQPFIVATVAVAIADASRARLQQAAAVVLVLWLVPAWDAASGYVEASRNPIELRNGSSSTVLPAFRAAVRSADGPVVSATANPFLAKLEASTAIGHQVVFVGQEMFRNLLAYSPQVESALRRSHVKRRVFVLPTLEGSKGRRNAFNENPLARNVLRRGNCTLVMGTGSQSVLNRRTLPEGTRDLITRSCGSVRNELLFVSSALGQNYYLPRSQKSISFYQLENDVYFSGRTFSAAGRYALLQVLHPTEDIRLCIGFTKTLARDGANSLPRVTVAGTIRTTLATLGRGSARVCSRPLSPQRIAGQSYVMLDMGIDGRPPHVPRPGLLGVYGRGSAIDPRYVTSYVRDVSIVTDSEYGRLQAPLALRAFPQALGHRDLEYSGLYEDGWVAERAYAMLAPGPAADVVVKGETFGGAARSVTVLVDGRFLTRRRVSGAFELRVRGPASSRRRRVELRFSSVSLLPSPDGRPAAARLSFLGFAP
jgi:hypothetical protein